MQANINVSDLMCKTLKLSFIFYASWYIFSLWSQQLHGTTLNSTQNLQIEDS